MITLLLTLALIGLITWVLVTQIPQLKPIATFIVAVAIILMLLLVLNAVGFHDVAVPHLIR